MPVGGAATLATMVEDLASLGPELGFTFVDGRSIETHVSYANVERQTAICAAVLQDAGLRRGDRLGLIVSDNQEFLGWFLGAIRAGIIPVPLAPPTSLAKIAHYAERVVARLNAGGVAWLIVSEKIAALLPDLVAQCPSLRALQVSSLPGHAPRAWVPAAVRPGDIAFLQFTSGSTSAPKGVALTHANIVANLAGIKSRFALGIGDVGVSWLPLFHDMGLIGFPLSGISSQVSIVLLSPASFVRRPLSWLQALDRHQGTISVAPTFGYRYAQRRIRPEQLQGLNLRRWRVAGCGAEPVCAQDLEAFSALLAPTGFAREALLPLYGMAESSLAVTIPRAGTGARSLDVDASVLRDEGRAVPPQSPGDAARFVLCGESLAGHDVAIFAPDDAHSRDKLADHQVGEIRVCGPSVMRGYYRDADATAAAFAGAYLKTGDLGFVHQGEVVVCGRHKELLIIDGRNIFPQDIERAVYGVAGVSSEAVVAFGSERVPGYEGTEQAVLVVGVAGKHTIDEAALKQAVLREAAVALRQVALIPRNTIAKTSSGKPRRAEMRRRFESGSLCSRVGSRPRERAGQPSTSTRALPS